MWYASGIPGELVVHDTSYNFVPMTEPARSFMVKATASAASVSQQFGAAKDLVEINFQNDLAEPNEAFQSAITSVRGILDIYAFLTLATPSLLPVVIVHDEGSGHANVELFGFETPGRAHIGEESIKRFNALNFEMLESLLPAFEVATKLHAKSETELSQKIRSAVKMFRHGRAANDVQVQFLCKFTAVETLVCGSVLAGRGALLKKRIPELLNRITSTRVNELWELRCGASHEAAGTWVQFAHSLPEVETIATACLLFAAAHVNQIETIQSLWKGAINFALPSDLGTFDASKVWPVGSFHSTLSVLDTSALGWEK